MSWRAMSRMPRRGHAASSCLLLICLLTFAAGSGVRAEPAREFDWGFLASRQMDPHGNLRLKILGPFFEFTEEYDGDDFEAFRPLYSHTENRAAGKDRYEIVWPLCTSKKFQEQTTTRFLTAIYVNFDRENPGSRWRFWVLPFYYQGRDENLQPYWALFPLVGSIHEFLGMDEINFAAWPLFMTTRQNDLHGRHFVWPLVGRTTGDGVDRFRILPFYAKSDRQDRFSKRSYMWPFFTKVRYDRPFSYGGGYIVFPLWGHITMNYEETWYIIPPLNRFTRSEKQNKTHIVWPFFQYYTGTTEKLYLWPLWGTKVQRGSRTSFFLWPLFRFQNIDQGPTVKNYSLALPFYHSREDVDSTPAEGEEGEVLSKRKNFWPLYSYTRQGEEINLRILDLWPFKHSGPIERNLSPFWTLYSRDAKGETRCSELLWGLYRHRKRGEAERYVSLFPIFSWHRDDDNRSNREFSILKGLIGYETDEERRSLRLLYILRLGGAKKEATD